MLRTSCLSFIVFTLLRLCECQREPAIPFSLGSLVQILRTIQNVPNGRVAKLNDIILRIYGTNTTSSTAYRIGNLKRIFKDPNLDIKKPTMVYAHGYVELLTDDSVVTIINAYITHGGYNIVIVDWANMGFGNYLNVALDVDAIGQEISKALMQLLKRGFSLKGVHLIGHSLGAHVMSVAGESLAEKGFKVSRLTGLDAAYPGFYPSILGPTISKSAADFVDIIHTDGGGFGGPSTSGHADFWPNEGQAKQPGCPPFTFPASREDFCSHWRSWAFWAESVLGGEFLARKCSDYDTFLRGKCDDSPLVLMGLGATSDLRGNFYLRTAAKPPYALGERGAG